MPRNSVGHFAGAGFGRPESVREPHPRVAVDVTGHDRECHRRTSL
ncbi:hypothetical protein ACFC1R_31330 [Kitasatospora sp. NPDC056138]